MKISEVRRTNLRKLIDHYGGSTALSQRLGYATPSFLVQQAGPNPTREVTERTARKFEEKLGLPMGALDDGFGPPGAPAAFAAPAQSHAAAPPTPGPQPNPMRRATDRAGVSQERGLEMIADLIRMIGNLMESEHVKTPPPERFADLVALAVTDTMEHGGQPREGHIRNVVRLMRV